MTTERNFDHLAQAWLELGPLEAPERVIAAVLQAAETAPQARRPIHAFAWRSFPMTRIRMAAGVAAILVVALAAAYLLTRNETIGPAPTATPAVPAPSIQATPSDEPTAAPIAEANLVLVGSKVIAWDDPVRAGVVDYQVFAEVRNEGPGWAQFVRTPNGYRFLDAAGDPVSDPGWFGLGMPGLLGPGATGYLLDLTTWPGHTAAELVSIDAAVGASAFRSVVAPPGTIDVTDIAWQAAGSLPGLIASGTVTNHGSKFLRFAAIVVLCMGSDGEVLGASRANLENLAVDTPTTFVAIGQTPPLELGSCAESIGLVAESIDQN